MSVNELKSQLLWFPLLLVFCFFFFSRSLQNDLQCIEWDVKPYYYFTVFCFFNYPKPCFSLTGALDAGREWTPGSSLSSGTSDTVMPLYTYSKERNYRRSWQPWPRWTSDASVNREHLETHREVSWWQPSLMLTTVSSVRFCITHTDGDPSKQYTHWSAVLGSNSIQVVMLH